MDNLDNTYAIQLDTTKEHFAPFKLMSLYGMSFKSKKEIDSLCKQNKIGDIIHIGYIKKLKNYKPNNGLVIIVYIKE